MGTIARRDFLKAASVTAGAVPLAVGAKRGAREDVKISATAYSPIQEDPTRPKPHRDVAITDWRSAERHQLVAAAESRQAHSVLQITDLSLIVGGDKYSWPSPSPGADRNVNLEPGPEDDRQLAFVYTFDGNKRSWDGPKFNAGTGYRMEITVDANGHVSSRHRLLPCSLS